MKPEKVIGELVARLAVERGQLFEALMALTDSERHALIRVLTDYRRLVKNES